MKKFIMTVPLQKEGQLDLTKYTPEENSGLSYDAKTRFPIINVIANNASKGENIIVVPILTMVSDNEMNENVERNYGLLKGEITELSRKLGFTYEFDEVKTIDNEKIATQIKLFGDLIDKTENEDILYACITYGTKPTPIVIKNALNYAYRIRDEVSVDCIVYGRYVHQDKGPSPIFDVTALFHMDMIVNRVAELKIEDAVGAIKMMLDIS